MSVVTGIGQGLGSVQSIEVKEAVWTLTFVLPNTDGLQRGASVAINGVCLTATDIEGSTASFDVIPETLARSNLSTLEIGSTVNVERSLKMGDELGGHLLSGHVMGMGSIVARSEIGGGVDLVIEAPATMMKFIHEKGYIGLNGASLTIGEVSGQRFNIHLMPETLALTTFGTSSEGDVVNIEIDSMTQTVVATVERMLKQESGGGEA